MPAPLRFTQPAETQAAARASHHRLTIQSQQRRCKHPLYDCRHGEADWRRGYRYLHSTFCDLVITGLVGLRPRADDTLIIHPLVPDTVQWFALDSLLYHGLNLAVIWDLTGKRYGRGAGLSVWADGQLLAKSARIQRLEISLMDKTELS